MGKSLAILIGSLAILAVGVFVIYSATAPDLKKTERETRRFFETAAPGVSLASAVAESPNFSTVILGTCGHIDASPDSGPKGSLIFSPPKGEFVRYTSFAEFIARNPRLFSEHEECRHVRVLYMSIFPSRGVVDVLLDERGLITKKSEPLFFQ